MENMKDNIDPPQGFYYMAIIAALLVIGSYFSIIYYYSVNIPFWDDYTHLHVVAEIVNSDYLSQKINLLFSLHNEHRIVLARLITLGILRISGEINFIVLVMLGNLSMIGIGLLLFINFCKTTYQDFKGRVIYFLPVVFLLFNLTYFEASTWAMASLSSLMVIFLAFLCLFVLWHSLSWGRWALPLAFFLGISSLFTQGNGLLVLYVGILLLLLQKRFLIVGWWTLGAVVSSFLYFYGYTSPEAHPSPGGALAALDMVSQYLLVFLGAWSPIPLITGILLVALFIVLTFAGLYRKNPVLFGFLMFVMGSALAVTLSRYGMGVEQALSSRYQIYSLLFFALLYMSVFEFIGHQRRTSFLRYGFPVLLALSLGINLYTTVKISDAIADRQQMLINGLVEWQKHGEGLIHWDNAVASRIIGEAMQQEIYQPPEFPSIVSIRRDLAVHTISFENYKLPVSHQAGWIDAVEHEGNLVRVLGWVYLSNQEPSQVIHIFMPVEVVEQKLVTISRPDVVAAFNSPALDYSGFEIEMVFESAESARLAAAELCMAAESAQTPLTLLNSRGSRCQLKASSLG